MLRKFTYSSLAVLFSQCAEVLIYAISTVVLARHFGSHLYGILAFYTSFTFIVQTIDSVWIRPIIVREMTQRIHMQSDIIGTMLITRIGLTLVCVYALIILSLFFESVFSASLVSICAIHILCISILNTLLALAQAKQQLVTYTICNISSKCLLLIIVCIASSIQMPLATYYGVSIIPIVLCIITIAYFSFRIVKPRFKLNSRFLSILFLKSWPLIISSLCIALYHRIDHVFILHYFGNTELGTYSVATKIVETLTIIAIAVITPLFPLLAKLLHANKIVFQRLYSICFKYFLLFIIPSVFFIFLISPKIIPYLFGEEYHVTGSVMQILIWSEIFVFLGIVNNALLIITKKISYDVIFTGASAILNIVLNLLFIPIWGVKGAAIATVCSYAVGPMLGLCFRETRPYSMTMLKYTPIPSVIGLTLLVCFTVTHQSIAALCIAYLISLIAVLLLSYRNDRKMFRIVFKGLKDV